MRQSTTRKNIIVFVTAALTFTTAACTTPAPAPTPPEPEQVSFAALDADAKLLSHRWTAPDGVSLDLRILQAVRSLHRKQKHLQPHVRSSQRPPRILGCPNPMGIHSHT